MRRQAGWFIGLVATVALASCSSSAALVASPPRTGATPSARASSDLSAVDAAADRESESTLRNALAASKTFYTDAATYSGLDAVTAAAVYPAVRWADGGAATEPSVIHIHVIDGDNLILDTLSDSGTVLCIEDSTTSGTTYGKVDATTVGSCTGAW